MKESSQILIIDENVEEVSTFKNALVDANVGATNVTSLHPAAALTLLEEKNTLDPGLLLLVMRPSSESAIRFLKERMEHDDVMIIPVVVLATVDDPSLKATCYRLNIAGYISNPSDYEDLIEAMKVIHRYWSFSEAAVGD